MGTFISGLNASSNFSDADEFIVDQENETVKMSLGQLKQHTGASVNSIDELKNLAGAIDDQAVEVLGYYEAGDGGGGSFYWDATSTEADNGGTIIQADAGGTGRWKRVYSGAINVKWFGAKDDFGEVGGDTNNAPFILEASLVAREWWTLSGKVGEILIPEGDYLVEGLIISRAVNIRGINAKFHTKSRDTYCMVYTPVLAGVGPVNTTIQGLSFSGNINEHPTFVGTTEKERRQLKFGDFIHEPVGAPEEFKECGLVVFSKKTNIKDCTFSSFGINLLFYSNGDLQFRTSGSTGSDLFAAAIIDNSVIDTTIREGLYGIVCYAGGDGVMYVGNMELVRVYFQGVDKVSFLGINCRDTLFSTTVSDSKGPFVFVDCNSIALQNTWHELEVDEDEYTINLEDIPNPSWRLGTSENFRTLNLVPQGYTGSRPVKHIAISSELQFNGGNQTYLGCWARENSFVEYNFIDKNGVSNMEIIVDGSSEVIAPSFARFSQRCDSPVYLTTDDAFTLSGSKFFETFNSSKTFCSIAPLKSKVGFEGTNFGHAFRSADRVGPLGGIVHDSMAPVYDVVKTTTLTTGWDQSLINISKSNFPYGCVGSILVKSDEASSIGLGWVDEDISEIRSIPVTTEWTQIYFHWRGSFIANSYTFYVRGSDSTETNNYYFSNLVLIPLPENNQKEFCRKYYESDSFPLSQQYTANDPDGFKTRYSGTCAFSSDATHYAQLIDRRFRNTGANYAGAAMLPDGYSITSAKLRARSKTGGDEVQLRWGPGGGAVWAGGNITLTNEDEWYDITNYVITNNNNHPSDSTLNGQAGHSPQTITMLTGPDPKFKGEIDWIFEIEKKIDSPEDFFQI